MVKKKQLRDFLNAREQGQRSDIYKAFDDVEKVVLNDALITDNVSIDWWKRLYDEAKAITNKAQQIRDKFNMWDGPIRDITRIDDLSTFDSFMKATKEAIRFDRITDDRLVKAKQERDKAFEALAAEYRKLQGVVDSTTAKKAFDYLKEVGFDLSSIDDEPKNELAAVKPNLEVLGLPEIKE